MLLKFKIIGGYGHADFDSDRDIDECLMCVLILQDIMASHLLSTEEQQSRAIKQPRVQGVRNAETVYGGEKRPKVAREAFENQEVSKGVPVPEAPALSDEEVALMLHREMNVQPFLRRSSLGTKDKPADPVGASINEHLAMLVEKITGFKCDQNA